MLHLRRRALLINAVGCGRGLSRGEYLVRGGSARGADGHLRLAMLRDALPGAIDLARLRLQSTVASLRRETSILFQIKQNDIEATSQLVLGGLYCCGPRRGCGAKNAIPVAPQWACAAVRPTRARGGRRARKGRRRWACGVAGPAATYVCKCQLQPPARSKRSPGAAMPRLLLQQHQGGWGVAPSHLPAARVLRATDAQPRPKATLRIHMQMPMKTRFFYFQAL